MPHSRQVRGHPETRAQQQLHITASYEVLATPDVCCAPHLMCALSALGMMCAVRHT